MSNKVDFSFKIGILLIMLFIFYSCINNSTNKLPEEVEAALIEAKENREELEKVIKNYSSNTKDSLKLQAAYFLIGNMPGHYFYKGKLLDNYLTFLDSTLNKSKRGFYGKIYESYQDLYGPLDLSKLVKVYDIQYLKANYLIQNIEHAFKVKNEQPWAKNIDFATFCNFILPYRVGNEEPTEWREKFYLKYNSLLDSIRARNGSAIDACKVISLALKDSFRGGIPFIAELPSLGPANLHKYKAGTCREQSQYTAFVMRALAIPVSIDFTPQWPFRSLGHFWNAVFDKNGKAIKFMGTETIPGEPQNDYKFGKIYRYTYEKGSTRKAIEQEEQTIIPDLFLSNFVDATDEFTPTVKVRVNLDNSNVEDEKFVYLAVFNNTTWIPITQAKVDNGFAIFNYIEKEVVFLPVYFLAGGMVVANKPFFVTKEGKVRNIFPSKKDKQTVVLKRKYPFFKRMDDYIKRMKGGRFQIANNPDFIDAIDIYGIDTIPDPQFYEFKVNQNEKFRYFRYLSPNGAWGNIAEIEVFGQNGKEIKGKIIGTKGTWEGTDRTKEKAFDKDIVTFFDAPIIDGAWVGLDFIKPEYLSKVRFIPRNDGNTIEKGDYYELVYWDNGWNIIGSQSATADSLIFNNVPTNALYLLHDKTKGIEERIFTYENNQQVWW
jgi:transposase